MIAALFVAFLLQTAVECTPNTDPLVVGGTGLNVVIVYPFQISGSSSTRFDVVFVGEGFKASEEDVVRFEAKIGEAIKYLSVSPYARCAFNFYWVRLVSNGSGSDHPFDSSLPQEERCKDTPLNSYFGRPGGRERELFVDLDDRQRCSGLVDSIVPNWDVIVVLVNDATYGGINFDDEHFLTVSVGEGFQNVLLHEMGHAFAGLGDEYGDLVDWETYYPIEDGEPDNPNVTINTDRPLKWPVDLAVPIPTDLSALRLKPEFEGKSDAELEQTVGLWEGAARVDRGAFRPQFDCRMRSEPTDFCTVCTEAVAAAKAAACAAPILEGQPQPRPLYCIAGSTVRVPLPPCPKCLTAVDEETLARLRLSRTDRVRVEIGPLPGVEVVRIIRREGSLETVVATGHRMPSDPSSPAASQPIFGVEFPVEASGHYYIEFSPATCEVPRFSFSVRVFVNGVSVRLL
jgi:hypothetical protein